MNRRGILGMLGAAPFAGGAIGQDVASLMTGNAGTGLASNAAGGLSSMGRASSKPLMERQSAMQLILGDSRAMAEIRDELWAEQRTVTQVDPDLLVLKSFSPMAKITFQRQRNVERALADALDDRYDMPRRYIRALSSRLDKLMWGKP